MSRVTSLYGTTSMTAAERSVGRFMRAPDGHESFNIGEAPQGGSDSTSSQNNGDVKSGDSNNGGGTADNTSQGFDPAAFWNDQPDEGGSKDDSGDEQSKALGGELTNLITGFQPAPLFTKEVADQIADGNLEGVNKAFQAAQQESLRQGVMLTTKILGPLMQRMEAQFDARLQAALGNKDNEVALETHFPAAKDPAVRPMIERVFDQALKNSKGNRQEAVKLTRQMLDAFGQKTGLSTPPSDPSSTSMSRASQSLVDDLLGRSQ